MEQGGRGSVYELDGPGLESTWGENFRTHPDMYVHRPTQLPAWWLQNLIQSTQKGQYT